MTVLTMAAGYAVLACVHAALMIRRFGSHDRVVLVWLSVFWPLSLLTLLVLLPLERTRFAPSQWRRGRPSRTDELPGRGTQVSDPGEDDRGLGPEGEENRRSVGATRDPSGARPG